MVNIPAPNSDWMCQRELAELFGVSPRTASAWSKAGRLRQYEHRFENCGRRKYSRALIEKELQLRWGQAVQRQEDLLQEKEQQDLVAGETALI